MIHMIHMIALTEILCKAPPVVVNTSMTVDGVRVNDTVTYSCLAGYRRQAGNLTKVCTESGQWQNDDPQCIGESAIVNSINVDIF